MTSPLRRIMSAFACTIALAASCAAAEVQDLAIDSSGRAIAVTRYAAEGAQARPAVVVLHGSSGVEANPEVYARPARALADNGIDAYLVRYFGRGSGSRCYCWDDWAQTVADVTTAILRRPEASGRIGLLGFSLGGAVAVVAARDPRIGALVVFYGFIPNEAQRARIDRLPPLLVLHGAADENVRLSSGMELVELARQRGGRAELVVYPGEAHGHSTWREPAASDAINRTVAFFRAALVGR
jgi:carboxymethylenebutenolidase